MGWGIIWYSSRPKPPKPWDTKALTAESEGLLKGVYPAFIPAKGRARFCLHVEYPTTLEKPPDSATETDRKAFHKSLEKFATDQFANLNGFELFDEGSRYEILFAPAWRENTKAK